jgi:YtkA-like
MEQEFEKSPGGVIRDFRQAANACTVVQSTRRVRTEFRMGIWRTQRNRVVCAIACAAVLLALGCRKPVEPQSGVSIEYGISPQPVRVGPAVLTVKLRDAADKPVAGARVTFEANMSHPGMAPAFAEAKEGEPGQYQGSVEFAMAGDWVVLIHVTLPDGRKLERKVNVANVTSN